jgi:hypothetical protein
LKQLRHFDGNSKWEDTFSEALKDHGIYADAKTTSPARRGVSEIGTPVGPSDEFKSAVKQFCVDRGLRYDFRAPSGRMIVYADGDRSQISLKLSNWGFEFDQVDNRWVRQP